MRRLHIGSNFFHSAQLVGRFLKGERRLQLLLNRSIRAEAEAGECLAFGVELHQLAGHFKNFLARPLFEFFPRGSAQSAEDGHVAFRAGVACAVDLAVQREQRVGLRLDS